MRWVRGGKIKLKKFSLSALTFLINVDSEKEGEKAKKKVTKSFIIKFAELDSDVIRKSN